MENTTKFRRIVIVAPMRSHCETVRAIFENGPIETYLKRTRSADLEQLKTLEHSFGIVAGTGVGKTVFLKDICKHHYGQNFPFSVVTKENEATDATWQAPVLVCTTGIAMHYLQADKITNEDAIIIDEIHQTSEHLELSMALAKYKGIQVNWMSATVDPEVYLNYFGTQKLLHADWKDPEKRAKIKVVYPKARDRMPWFEQFMENHDFLNRIVSEKRGVAVFLPSRAMCEQYASQYSHEPGVTVDFYHGGESAAKLRDYLRGNVRKPFILFMTIAGSSSLNVTGLDTVIIHDEMYNQVVNEWTGVRALQRLNLGNNELLQMIGRVDGRVHDGEVYILTERSIYAESLKPEVPKFVLAGDLEQVALTCARCHIELKELDPIGGIKKVHYAKTHQALVERGLISPDNRLTEYGEAVCRFPVPRVWAEHLVRTPHELLPFVTVISACPSLYNMLNRDKTKQNIKEFKVANDDFLTKYKILQFVIDHFAVVVRDQNDGSDRFHLRREFYDWAKEKGIYPRVIKEVLLSIAALCREMGISLRAVCEEFPDANEKVAVVLRQLYLEVGALTFVASGSTSDGTIHASPSDASNCYGRPVIIGQTNAIETKYGVRHDIEGVSLCFDDLKPHLDASQRSIDSIQLTPDADQIKVRYAYPGFGFKVLAYDEIAYNELPADDLHRLCIPKLVEVFASRVTDMTLYNDDAENVLAPEIVESNRRIITLISEYRRACHKILNGDGLFEPYCYKAAPLNVANEVYNKLLEGTGIYTLAAAKKANFDFRLSESLIPTEPLPEKPKRTYEPLREPAYRVPEPRFGTNIGSLMNGAPMPIKHMNGSRVTRPDPTIGAVSLNGIKPMKTKAEVRREQERAAREALKAELKAQWLDEPQGQTQARVDWLADKAEKLRAKLTEAEAKLMVLRTMDEKAAEKYNAEFAKGDKGNAYTAWVKASEAVMAANETLIELKKKLDKEIDKLETEALEIMEELERKSARS